jgi:hypothetical protein
VRVCAQPRSQSVASEEEGSLGRICWSRQRVVGEVEVRLMRVGGRSWRGKSSRRVARGSAKRCGTWSRGSEAADEGWKVNWRCASELDRATRVASR